MYLVVVAGGIASGKSTVAKRLEQAGALRLDLDVLSHEVYVPGSDVLARIAEAFGADVVDEETGDLRRSVLATRAFASAEATARLEAIVHPAVTELMWERLAEATAPVAVVEVPLPDRVPSLLEAADEVVVVTCPLELRRERAIARGMDGSDFDARVARQVSDEWLVAHADHVIANDGDRADLERNIERWLAERGGTAWQM